MQNQENPMPRSYSSFYVGEVPVVATATDIETGTGTNNNTTNPVEGIPANLITTEIHNIKMNIEDIETKMKRTVFSYVGEIASNILLLILAIKVFGNL